MRPYFLSIILLLGCATKPVDTSLAKPIPQNQILEQQFINPSKDSGVVIVKRDSGVSGSGCAIRLFIDGKPTADLHTKEKVVVYLPPGDHLLSAKPTGICGGGISETSVVVILGQTKIFRVGYSQGMDTTIQPTAF